MARVEGFVPPYKVDKVSQKKAREAFFDPSSADSTPNAFLQELIDIAKKSGAQKSEQVMAAIESIAQSLHDTQQFDEKYLGHMLTEASIPAMIAYMMAIRTGSNTVAEEVSKRETQLEPEAIKWMERLIGYDPKKASGTFTSGGSLANTTALWVAREIASDRVKTNSEADPQRFVVLANPFVHYSIEKSVRLLAGPREGISLIKLPSENLRLSPEAVEEAILYYRQKQIYVMAVVAIAGETETGVVDDLNAIANITEKYGVYFHADAAYGLPYKMSSRAALFKGIERANSVTFDPHKVLNTPYSAGVALFRDSKDHAKVSFSSKDAEYVFKDGKASLGQKRIEGSMGAGPILSTVAAIRALSPDQWKATLDHTLNNVEYLYHLLSSSKVLMPIQHPDLNVLCFTIRPEYCLSNGVASNEALKGVIESTSKQLLDETGYFFSTTNLHVDNSIRTLEKNATHQAVYRAVMMHPRTEQHHILEAVTLLEARIQKHFCRSRN